MKAYFLHDGNQKTGPFTFEELQQKGVEASSLIWFDGLSTWTKAGEIPELSELLLKSPPPLLKQSALQSAIEKTKEVLDKDIVDEIENKIPSKKGKRYFTWGVVLLAILGLFFLLSYVFKSSFSGGHKGKATDSLVVIKAVGEVHPDWYDNSKNYIGIRGTIVNKSTSWEYKNFVIEVEYYDLDKKLIETKKYTVRESIRPQKSYDLQYRIDGEIPAGKREYTLKWKLLDATQVLPE
jgi:hypothetical protein